jgi:hypothetical protein
MSFSKLEEKFRAEVEEEVMESTLESDTLYCTPSVCIKTKIVDTRKDQLSESRVVCQL